MAAGKMENAQMTSRGGDDGGVSENQVAQPAARAHRFRARHAAAAVIGLAIVSLVALGIWRRDGPAPVLPEELEQFDPELVSMIEDLAAAVQANPRDPNAHGRLGLVYEANSLFDEARRCYETVVQLADSTPWWSYHLAIATRQAGDFDGAMQLLRSLARKHPKFAAVHHRLGAALLEAGHFDEAAIAFQRARDLAPSTPAPMVGLADVKLRQHDHANAASLLQRAIEIDPTYKAAHYSLGLAYRGLGRSQEAARELARGLNATPRFMPDPLSKQLRQYMVYPAGRAERAVELAAAGQTAEAAALLEKGLVTRPQDIGMINELSKIYVQMSQYDKALELLSRAKRLNEHDFRTFINLARCCLAMGRHAEALAHADRAAELAPTNVRTHLSRASVLRAMGRHDEALPALEAAVQLEPRSAELHVRLARTCLRLGRDGQAETHARTAIDLSPESFQAHLTLFTASIRQGHLQEAASTLSIARRIAPDDRRVTAMQRRLAERRASEQTPEEG